MLVDDGARERMRERRLAPHERGELVFGENEYDPFSAVR